MWEGLTEFLLLYQSKQYVRNIVNFYLYVKVST
jgi:hypothetical protein